MNAHRGDQATVEPGKAAAQTTAMLRWWARAGIDSADLAARRPDGAMLWQFDCALADLPLPWARAHNVKQADVYVRPARGGTWSLIFLDDVAPAMARRIAAKYASLLVRTSPAGGCHLWLCVAVPLDEQQRYRAQRWLVPRVGADPGSVSGEHLGRLAGMKNWKRKGVWVNIIPQANVRQPAWDPAPALRASAPRHTRPIVSSSCAGTGSSDQSQSAQEWGWVCGALEAGASPDAVYRQLVHHASQRRGLDTE
ncbi:MAG: DNA-primase RepB domain-containing protein, partial [Pseudomonadota bacterium]|nr:DNA-primase RepB domain-containing protein [Pseudomonadota bacterium]